MKYEIIEINLMNPDNNECIDDKMILQMLMMYPQLIQKISHMSQQWKEIIEENDIGSFIVSHVLSHDVCRIAARENNLSALEYFYELGYPIDFLSIFYECAENNFFKCFKFICRISNVDKNDSKWCNNLAIIKNVKYIRYAHEHGFAVSCNGCILAAKYGNNECLKYIISQLPDVYERIPGTVCEIASRYGKCECLQIAHESGFQWNSDVVMSAIIVQSYECLIYAVENGCSFNLDNCLSMAITTRNEECIKYLQQLKK